METKNNEQVHFYVDDLNTHTYFPQDSDTDNWKCDRVDYFTEEKHLHSK